MYVNTTGLRAGGKDSYTAADHADQSAGTLARTAVGSGMFGNFAEAKAFGQKIIDAHTHNVGLINSHTKNLGGIGDHARGAAAEFEDMEHRNEAQIRAVRDAL